MRFKDLFKTALSAITSNKLKAFLSMLGVVIGIGSVVVVVAISEGAKATIQGQIDQMGTNTINGHIYNMDRKGLDLQLEDLYPMANSNDIDYVTVEINNYLDVINGDKTYNTQVTGVDTFYFDYKELNVQAGRRLNFGDIEAKRNFAVIGTEASKELFGMANPIGQKFMIRYVDYRTNKTSNFEYTVIGLLEEQPDSMFGSINGNVYIPVTRAQEDFGSKISSFYIIGSDTKTLDVAQDDAQVYIEGLIYPYIVDQLNKEDSIPTFGGRPIIGGGGFYYPAEDNEIVVEEAPAEVIMASGENEMGIMPPFIGGGGWWGEDYEPNPVQDYYNLFNTGDFIDQALGMINTVTLLISGIAAISLLVGGIGIANVMFMSVLERTSEIGLRKAIGARNIDITLQFLIESVIITVIGGMFGLLLGAGIAKAVTLVVKDMNAVLNVKVMVVTFLVSVLTGILAGFFPSRKASKLNPIDALRHE